MERGPCNAITDVAGVRVGHVTLVRGEGRLVRGQGPVRTGVTAVVPGEDIYRSKFVAGAHVINGFGKMTGLPQVMELGRLETPIVLTNTLSAWTAADALAAWMCERHPEIGVTAPTVNPVVGECNDGWLNDIQGRHVKPEHVWEALERAAPGSVPVGAVGAGTGMVCYGWKGGIGTASRVWDEAVAGGRVTLGCLVLANFGRRRDLVVDGWPVGRMLDGDGRAAAGPRDSRGAPAEASGPPRGEGGSVIVILATDAPLTSRQLTRIARRAEAGLARTGTANWHGSGDFALAFSTARAYPPYLPDEGEYLNPFFEAVAEIVPEAVTRALFEATTMTGRDGHTAEALPRTRVEAMLAELSRYAAPSRPRRAGRAGRAPAGGPGR